MNVHGQTHIVLHVHTAVKTHPVVVNKTQISIHYIDNTTASHV